MQGALSAGVLWHAPVALATSPARLAVMLLQFASAARSAKPKWLMLQLPALYHAEELVGERAGGIPKCEDVLAAISAHG